MKKVNELLTYAIRRDSLILAYAQFVIIVTGITESAKSITTVFV